VHAALCDKVQRAGPREPGKGILRVLELSPSGRGLLEEHGPRFPKVPGRANDFASLGSPRWMEGLRDVGRAFVQSARRASQHSLKFIRWLRRSLRDQFTEHAALPLLRALYASSWPRRPDTVQPWEAGPQPACSLAVSSPRRARVSGWSPRCDPKWRAPAQILNLRFRRVEGVLGGTRGGGDASGHGWRVADWKVRSPDRA